MSLPVDTIENLAAHVHDGDVVFFIGSGFSNDTEKNNITRIHGRLLARLRAMSGVLREWPASGAAAAAYDSYEQLILTFDLKRTQPDKPLQEYPVLENESGFAKLGERYFEANEWFCNEFGRLLRDLSNTGQATDLLRAISAEENRLLGDPNLIVAAAKGQPDPVPLDPIGMELVELSHASAEHRRSAGKMLFLDTIGFANPAIMGGEPRAKDIAQVEQSYTGRLLPRHRVLARLAREGLCTTVLTTNFDLLIEGAFRLAGFVMKSEPAAGAPDTRLPPVTYEKFARVTSPVEFFKEGKAHHTAVIVKMHGCAEGYRVRREFLKPFDAPEGKAQEKAYQVLKAYLPSLVFTYREIQNWRTDSWAADYVRTLLRTRVVVFCGYSIQDPVIHDTFRTVYEEMARLSSERGAALPSPYTNGAKPELRLPREAPAFFFAYGGPQKREFYAEEILNAASRAVGGADCLEQHPNMIAFNGRGTDAFPDLDETLQWLFHRTFRERQKGSLGSDLRRISTLLLRHSPPECDLEVIRKDFEKLRNDERDEARTARFDRDCLLAMCRWSENFHPGLLREFAAADVMHRRQGPGAELAMLRKQDWYYPAGQDTGWTAWGAVVELAIRRLAARAFTSRQTLREVNCVLKPSTSHHPTVWFHPPPETKFGAPGAPRALTILFSSFLRSFNSARLKARPVKHIFWQLHSGDAPWPPAPAPSSPSPPLQIPRRASDGRILERAPDAGFIWQCAIGRVPEDSNNTLLTPWT